MQRDLVHFTATKLQGGWSAADFSRYLTAENLKQLLPRIDKFEPLVRVRILLSLLTLDKGVKQACHDELQVCRQVRKSRCNGLTFVSTADPGHSRTYRDNHPVELDCSGVENFCMVHRELLLGALVKP